MNPKKIRTIIKNRYRLSTKVQMNFEMSFPNYLIGKCCFSTDDVHEIRTQKVSPSLAGLVFSDTIPLSWFTSSVLIPWAMVLNIAKSENQSLDGAYFTIQINDPQDITIDLPWSQAFTKYIQKNKLFDI